MRSLLIGSNNPGKIQEIRSLLQGLDLEIFSPFDMGIELQVEESGSNYYENARIKALAYAHLSGTITLADDSGLEVDALGGLPGIRSARFVPQKGATDKDRRNYLIERLLGIKRPWKARFFCVVAISTGLGEIQYSEGECHGEIIPEHRGKGGFGYDPIFLIPELGLTMAELSMKEKNLISHRALAILSARSILLG